MTIERCGCTYYTKTIIINIIWCTNCQNIYNMMLNKICYIMVDYQRIPKIKLSWWSIIKEPSQRLKRSVPTMLDAKIAVSKDGKEVCLLC